MSDREHRRLAAVTGITGFVGGHLAAALGRRGWRIRALVRSMPRLGPQAEEPIEIVQGGLSDRGALADLVAGADAILHLAGAIKGRPETILRANAAGTEALAEAWRDHGFVSNFVHLSSMAARAPHLSPYAASKAEAEARLERVGVDAPWSILRPAAIYGPGDRETLRIFRAADGAFQPMLNGPGARVAAIHVDDVTNAIVALAEHPVQGGVFELTDENHSGYSWPEVAAGAARALGRTPRPIRVPAFGVQALARLGDLTGRVAGRAMLSTPKAREILHEDWSSDPARQPPTDIWRPEIPLDQGFAATVAWYRAQGWL